MRVYDQAVLLKGLNNKKTNLLELLDELQCLNIESYYLCHCVPMAGMVHFRTSVDKGLNRTLTILDTVKVDEKGNMLAWCLDTNDN